MHLGFLGIYKLTKESFFVDRGPTKHEDEIG